MDALETKACDADLSVQAAISAACESIAPTWPLDRMIAVSPYWTRISQSFETVAYELEKLAGSPLTMPFSYYRQRWLAGEINER
ncbi:MAG TPA: putative inorganic carbon transporter subunit DabA, partial [Methylophilaceae bacterium]|nr:putative inorganic carbon transporter subunit DabA [Methylophilaceae bacterium]